MVRRIPTFPILRLAAAGAAAVTCLVLVTGTPDSAAHGGHTAEQWEFTWNRGSTERLLRYRFWHYNTYKKQTCTLRNNYAETCYNWQDTGATRTRREDSCAARPEWVVAQLDSNRKQREPAPPSGSTCNRHGSYYDGDDQWVFTSHKTKRIAVDRSGGPRRCRLPITGIQSASISTDTSPPGGKSTVYRSSRTQPSRGAPARCGWWSGARSHPANTTATTATTRPTTTTSGFGGAWRGTCSFSFTVGRSYSRSLPTHSGRVSGYSYSGNRPAGMTVRSSPPRISGSPTRAGTFTGTLEARISGGRDAAISCTFRVSAGTATTTTTSANTTTTTNPRPKREDGWLSGCYVTMQLGSDYGTRREPEEPLPWYRGADQVRYSGSRPGGVGYTRIEGEAYLYGAPTETGSFKGRVTAWRGSTRLSTQNCLIVVRGGSWSPSTCEFHLETGMSYDLTMPRYRGPRVDRYYPSGALPPGLSSSGSGVKGTPEQSGSWSVSWTAVLDNTSTRPTITCTFHVTARPVPSGWSGTCNWTFTVGYSYTRLLPVADGATRHRWSGGVPAGMRMTYSRQQDVWALQLSGTPTTEGVWNGTLSPSPRPKGTDDLHCSFEVLPGPDTAQCSLTVPSSELDRVRGEIEWRSDLPRTAAHAGIPGGESYLFTTGDPGVGGRSPRIWPWWSSEDALIVTDTTGCQWKMTGVISAARPVFPWYGDGSDTIRRVATAMHKQWQAMTPTQRMEVEATGRRVLRRVGLGTPEDGKWLGKACRPGDNPETDCVWGLPFPGVWQWSLTVRYSSADDSRERDLTIASGATRFWRFGDRVDS